MYPTNGSIGSLHPEVGVEHALLTARQFDLLQHPLAIAGVDGIPPPVSVDLLADLAGDLTPAGVDVEAAIVRLGLEDGKGKALAQSEELILRGVCASRSVGFRTVRRV